MEKHANPLGADVEHLYKLQVENVRQYAMFVTDTRGVILTWNLGVEAIFGYSKDEFIGQHASLIFKEEDRRAGVSETEMHRAQMEGECANIRWHVRKDGSELYTHGVMQRVTDSDGKHIGFAKIVSDETLRKQLEDKLTASNLVLDQFAFAASHDLQEPLRAVSLSAQLLLSRHRENLAPHDADLIQHIITGASRMQRLINDMLDYAHAVEGDAEARSAGLDDDLETALSQLSRLIEETGAKITHDPLPFVNLARSQMVSLFQNLLSNAMKYRSPDRYPVVHVSSYPSGGEWVISVKDNGVGFDPVHSERIFRMFQRLHGREVQGTGLGLALCKRIVESHGGRIWAVSQVGEGSTFYFTLPGAKNEQA